MAQRNSSLAKSYRGQDIKTTLNNGGYTTSYAPEKGTPAEVSKLIGEATIPASVKPIEFNVIKAYYERKGASAKNATTLSLLTIDAARINDVSPMSLLRPFDNTEVALDEFILYTLNKLGNTTSLLATAQVKDNSQSYKADYIKA
jgi:hypothetical protein